MTPLPPLKVGQMYATYRPVALLQVKTVDPKFGSVVFQSWFDGQESEVTHLDPQLNPDLHYLWFSLRVEIGGFTMAVPGEPDPQKFLLRMGHGEARICERGLIFVGGVEEGCRLFHSTWRANQADVAQSHLFWPGVPTSLTVGGTRWDKVC